MILYCPDVNYRSNITFMYQAIAKSTQNCVVKPIINSNKLIINSNFRSVSIKSCQYSQSNLSKSTSKPYLGFLIYLPIFLSYLPELNKLIKSFLLLSRFQVKGIYALSLSLFKLTFFNTHPHLEKKL